MGLGRERERGSAARLGWVAGPRALLGRAGECGCRHECTGRPRGWAELEVKKEESARSVFLFFFFKNMNSKSICLFH
jgi:hypothetical protein